MDVFNTAFLHSQVFWAAISFAVMGTILVWKVLPAITTVLDERADKIRTDLTTAEEKRAEAETALAAYEAKLAEAKAEAAAMLNVARTDAKTLVDTRLSELEQEIAKRRDDAHKSIESAKAQAMTELQSEVAALAVTVTEQLLAESVDAKKAKSLTDKAVKSLVN